MRPKYFKIDDRLYPVGEWIIQNNLIDKVSYDWVRGIIAFDNEEDATAFSLVFNARSHQTLVDKMLDEYEED